MEGLRGFAVLLVFLVHYESLVAPWIASNASLLAVTEAVKRVGNAGVDLFFVLSGYLIYASLLTRDQSFLHFFARRLQRIYPAFTTVFAIYLLLSLLVPSQSKIPADGAALYLLANYLLLPGLFPIPQMITVAWSLSYEMFYYLAIPILFAALKLRARTVGWRLSLFVSITIALCIYGALRGGPVSLIMFIAGIVLFEVLHHSELRIAGGFGLLALIAGLACQLWPPDDPASTTLKGGFMLLAHLIPPTGDQSILHWVLLPPMLVLTVLTSAVLFVVVERPFSLTPRPIRDVTKAAPAGRAS